MKSLLTILVFYICNTFGNYSIVFVHVGDNIPLYAHTAIKQARLFNLEAQIILLSSTQGLKQFPPFLDSENIQLYSYDELRETAAHKQYKKKCAETSPFWRFTSERFLYLWDLMETLSLENVFHLENDNMLYADLKPLLPHFQNYYPGIAATFDNEDRCIPGFVWISNSTAMKPLVEYFTKKAPARLSDMAVIGSYRKAHPTTLIDTLPIIMPDYAIYYPLKSPHNHKTNHPQAYSNHSDIFNAIFDAAAIGQFLGGIDPIHENNAPGFINESCIFNPSLLEYQWIMDEQGRSIPYACFHQRFYKIINLHIHSKRLHNFKS